MRLPRYATVLLAGAVLASAACASSQPSADPIDAPMPTTTRAATTSSSTTVPPTTTTSQPPSPDLDVVVAHWTTTWAIAGDPSAGPLPPTVTESAADTVARFLRGSDSPPVRTFVHAASAEVGGGDTVIVDDCLLATPPIGDSPAAWFRGTYDAGATLISVEAVALGGCVPASIASAAIAGYEDHWDAAIEYWVPADPSSPRIAETLTGDRLERVLELVTDHAAAGLELRGRPQTHPEIVEYRSPTEVVILDCQRADPERGLFDTTTGERAEGIQSAVDGQRDVRSALVRLVDGRWKVAERDGETDVDCEFAPTAAGIPVV